jgi:hypothetical protein
MDVQRDQARGKHFGDPFILLAAVKGFYLASLHHGDYSRFDVINLYKIGCRKILTQKVCLITIHRCRRHIDNSIGSFACPILGFRQRSTF